MKKHQYHLMIACAGALWGIISIFFKFLSAAGLDKIQVVVLRFGFAAVLLCFWLAVRSPQALRLRRPCICFILSGQGLPARHVSIFVIMPRLNAQALRLPLWLLYTAPAFVILFSRLLFAKGDKRKSIALILTMAGCAV